MKWFKLLLLAVLFLSSAVFVAADDETAEAEVVTKEEGQQDEPTKKEFDAFNEEERAKITETQETHQFQAEVNRLMDILINSLYSNREIFLRELISNAADALDKVRFLGLTDESLISEDDSMDIKISFDKKFRTVTITDNGIGMTKDDLMKNLGIIAKSGTTDFLEASAKGGDSVNLIGQFGVGFYSVYLVADKVTVVSKNAKDDQYIWESTADSVFTITKDPRGNTLGRGTSIILHLKEDAEEFLNESLLTGLITRYSQFTNFPISILSSKQVTKEVEIEDEGAEQGSEDEEDADDIEVSEEEEEEEGEKKKKTKTVTETVEEWKLVNEAKPIWMKNPKEVTAEEYQEFYKTLTKDTFEPLEKIHFVAEGEITFKAILYIPKKADPSIYDQYYEKSTGLKLYVRRVLINDSFDDFLPRYLNFIKGVVDSDDLPLNVSRETLAESRVLKVMGKKLTRKVLGMLRNIAERSAPEEEEKEEKEAGEKEEQEEDKKKTESDYEKFWGEYSKSIKMGVMDDAKNKAKLVKLLRYKSSKSEGKWTSFEQYVDRMAADQNKIYYLTCESLEQCETSPVMEKFQARGIEVLFMDEPIDEYCAQHVHEFDGIEPVNIMRESATLTETAAFKAMAESAEWTALIDWLKTTLGSKVSKVLMSNKLVSSPAVVTVPEYGWTGNMERIQRAQTLQTNSDMDINVPKKIFEVNPYHPIIKEIKARFADNKDDQALKDMVNILFDSASVVSGFYLYETEDFTKSLHKIIALSLDVDPDAKVVIPEPEPEQEAAADGAEEEQQEEEEEEEEEEAAEE